MYSTCIFCHQGLGANEVLENFPVGRRVAFDPARGRLWVVCARCTRWNLSPLEERWEVVEDCERLFRATTLRASTENIGLARVAEGTELVRVGNPQRPEFAAWRYGHQFGRRRRRALLQIGAVVGVSVPLLASGAYNAMMAAIPGGALLFQLPHWLMIYNDRRGIVTKAELESGAKVIVRGKHVPSARLLSPGRAEADLALRVEHDHGDIDFRGASAIRVASKLLAKLNNAGGDRRTVQRAVERLDYEGGPPALFAAAAGSVREHSAWRRSRLGPAIDQPGNLWSLAHCDRLALEMATHEESERRALEGELSALEAAWREAEEIAAIADSLGLPTWVEDLMQQHRRKHS